MKPIALSLPKIKIQRPKIKVKREILIRWAIFALVVLAIVGFAYLERSGRLAEINLGLFLAKFTAQLPKEEEVVPAKEIKVEEGEEVPAKTEEVSPKTYEEKANPGEGITHLARKALKNYLSEEGTNLNLTPEQKVYIEDYLQNKTGDRWLNLGETITFSEDLIKEAINSAQQLTPEELENLEQYSALVPSL